MAQLVTTVIFFSAPDKSRIKWDNSRNLTQKIRSTVSKKRYSFLGEKMGCLVASRILQTERIVKRGPNDIS